MFATTGVTMGLAEWIIDDTCLVYLYVHNVTLVLFSEYGVILTELTLAPQESLSLRQMTAVLLKQYVDTHWSSLSEKFNPPEVTPAAKSSIRAMLPQGLKESISKVRKRITHHCFKELLIF